MNYLKCKTSENMFSRPSCDKEFCLSGTRYVL